MLKATISSLLAHKVRLALTALSIVLGVGFVSGSFVMTDTLNNTFTNLFDDVNAKTDVHVNARPPFEGADDDGEEAETLPMPASVLSFLRTSVREMGQTVVMVTHDPAAASYADRVLFLADGRIVDEMTSPTAERVLDRMKAFDSAGRIVEVG